MPPELRSRTSLQLRILIVILEALVIAAPFAAILPQSGAAAPAPPGSAADRPQLLRVAPLRRQLSMYHPHESVKPPSLDLRCESKYSPVQYLLKAFSRVDRNLNGIDDKLENVVAKLDAREGANPTSTIPVIVVYPVNPLDLGGRSHRLLSSMNNLIKLAESRGWKVYSGPWTHVLVGFAVQVPVRDVKTLSQTLSLDVDGDGIPDRPLLELDSKVHVSGYLSDRLLNVRPFVWSNLSLRGEGVTVATVDTGVDAAVEGLTGKIVLWRDLVGDSHGTTHATPYDDMGHGTAVASLIAGSGGGVEPTSGRLVLTYGLSDFNWSEGVYIMLFSYYVNSTGTLEISFKWKGDPTGSPQGAVGSIILYHCPTLVATEACFNNADQVAMMSTPQPNRIYTLLYDIKGEGDYGSYFVGINVSKPGFIAWWISVKTPFSVSDGLQYSFLTGVAPEAHLVVVKALNYAGIGAVSTLIDAIDYIASVRNKTNPPIYIATLPFGTTSYVASLDTAISNLAHEGVLPVVPAGNEGPGSNYAGQGTPASNPYALTVGATDFLNRVTSYSSQGGPSVVNSSVIKPDATAPGGAITSSLTVGDTTYHDDLSNYIELSDGSTREDIDWADVINVNTSGYDDATLFIGTSFSMANAGGAAAIVVEGLLRGGYKWKWNTYEGPCLVKEILLATAYETYPLQRLDYPSDSPTLDRGGKDPHEGYGAIDVAAAARLALSVGSPSYILTPGSIVSGSFRVGYDYPGIGGIHVYIPYGSSTWSSLLYFPVTSFSLVNGSTYQAYYTIRAKPTKSTWDLDLYLMQLCSKYGEPLIYAKAASPVWFTVEESITIRPSSNYYILALKRASEHEEGGPWVLAVGPRVEVYGLGPDGKWHRGEAWPGSLVNITIYSAIPPGPASVEIYDNTTGRSLARYSVTLSQVDPLGSGAVLTIRLPSGQNLAGHRLVAIVQASSSSGGWREFYPAGFSVEGAAPQPSTPYVIIPTPYTPPTDILAIVTGFPPNTTVTVYLLYGGVEEEIASSRTDSSGDSIMVVGLPRNLAPGAYTLSFRASTPEGASVDVERDIIVVRPQISIVGPNTVKPGDLATIRVTGLGRGAGQAYAIYVGGLLTGLIKPGTSGELEVQVRIPPLPTGIAKVSLVYVDVMPPLNSRKYTGPAELASTTVVIENGIVYESELQHELSSVSSRLSQLETRVNGIQQRLDELQREINTMYNNITSLIIELNEMNNSLSNLEANLKALENYINIITVRLDIITNNFTKSFEELRVDINNINNSIYTLNDIIRSLNKTIKYIETDIANTKTIITVLKDEVNMLTQETMKINSTLKSSLASLVSKISALNSSLGSLRHSLTNIGDELLNIKQKIRLINYSLNIVTNKTIPGIKENTSRLYAGLSDLSTKIDLLINQISEDENKIYLLSDNLNNILFKISKINSTINSLNTTIQSLTAETQAKTEVKTRAATALSILGATIIVAMWFLSRVSNAMLR